jgi:hypothetical protein
MYKKGELGDVKLISESIRWWCVAANTIIKIRKEINRTAHNGFI